MGQIVFCVRDNKIGVPNRIVAVAGRSFLGRRNPRNLLGRRESSFGSREADKMFIEIVEPAAQVHRGVACGIGGNKNELDLIANTGGQFLQSPVNIRHVCWALIGAIGIAEKEKRDRALGSVPEIKRSTGGVRENKSRFQQGRRDQAAPIRCFRALGMGRVAFRFLPGHDTFTQ